MGTTAQDPLDSEYAIRPPKPRFKHDVVLRAAALSADGAILAALDAEGTLLGWDVRSGRVLYRRQVLKNEYAHPRLSCSPDGRWLAVTARYFPASAVRVFKLATGDLVRSFDRGFSPVFSPDGEILAAADGPALRRWALKSGAALPALGEEGPDLKWVAYSPKGTLLAASEENSREVRVWNLATRRRVESGAAGFSGAVTGLAFSPDGATLAIGSWVGVRFWNLADDEERDWASHEECTRGQLRFSSDGKQMIASIRQSRLLAWDVRTGLRLHAWGAFMLPDGLIEVSEAGDVAVWMEKGGIRLERLPKLLGGAEAGHVVRTIGFSADGLAMTGDDQGIVILWDPATQQEVRRIQVPRRKIRGFSADGKWAIFGGEDQPIHLWDLAAGKEVLQAELKPYLDAIALSPDRATLAVGHTNGELSLWDTATHRERCRVRLDLAGVTAIGWSPDGKKIAWGDKLGSVVIAEGTRGTEPLIFKPRGDAAVAELMFAPDGKSLTAADNRGDRRLYRDEAGTEPVVVKSAPENPELDDRWNASGYRQKNLSFIQRVMSPDRTYVLTATAEGTAMIWQAPGAK